MEKIRRAIKIFWLEHSDPIIFSAIVIVGIILVVQFLNQLAIQKREETANNIIINESQSLEINKETKENKEYTRKIEQFINSCKEGNVQEAYELISENCKKENYRTLEEFIEKYYNKIFYKKRIFEIEYQGKDDLYKVVFFEDIIETGTLESDNNIIDYYKIDEQDKIIINLNNNL